MQDRLESFYISEKHSEEHCGRPWNTIDLQQSSSQQSSHYFFHKVKLYSWVTTIDNSFRDILSISSLLYFNLRTAFAELWFGKIHHMQFNFLKWPKNKLLHVGRSLQMFHNHLFWVCSWKHVYSFETTVLPRFIHEICQVPRGA